MFPRFKSRKSKNLKSVLINEEELAEKIALRAKELQEKEAQEKKRQKMMSIYANLSPRQKRRLKGIAERKGVKDE